jgi:hypothetical protein
MKLRPNVLYRSKLKTVVIDDLPREVCLELLGNGREAGVFLEPVIARKFEGVTTAPRQGENPDLICVKLGKIQCKTWRHLVEEVFKSGPRKGLSKWKAKSIFTTKSGLWDSMKRRKALGEDVDKTIREYFDKYDCFMYIDIEQFGVDFSYSFIVLDTKYVKSVAVDGYIAPEDIISQIREEMYV